MPVPLCPGKYRSETLFSPDKFISYMKKNNEFPDGQEAPECVILCYQKAMLQIIKKNHKIHSHSGMYKDNLFYIEETNNKVAVMTDFGIGGPSAAATLEELIAWGCKYFLSIGTAGGLTKSLAPGSIVLCTSSYRDEGTSYHYLPGGAPALPDEAMTNAFAQALEQNSIDYSKCVGWTTDAVYRETASDVEYFVNKGASTVDMEASTLFTVARYRNVPMAVCFTISDSLEKEDWKPAFLSKDTKTGLELLYKAAISCFDIYKAM